MSENIQSIANGSFVLGQTSATTYQAGPGISITQPSEGTIRISNDETVLFDQSANQNCSVTAEFQMNESLWNFHRAFIVFDNMEYANTPVNMEIDLDTTTTDTTYYTPMRNGTSFPSLNIPYANFKINSSGNIKYLNRGLLWGNSWTAVNTTTADNRGYRVRKVIGINRISGGNA